MKQTRHLNLWLRTLRVGSRNLLRTF